MANWALLKSIFFGQGPPLAVTYSDAEELLPASLTMGTLFIGRQGSGKSSSLAGHLVGHFDAHPDEAIFVLDWSGDLSNKVLTQFAQRPLEQRDLAMRRIVYDEPGHPEYVLPKPELSLAYGGTYEDEIDRVKNNLNGLYHNASQEAVIMAGIAINKTLPEIYRVLASIQNQHGESWQVTEAERLIDSFGELKAALLNPNLPAPTKSYLQQLANARPDERSKRTYILHELFGWIRTPYMRARLGYYAPAWTPKEAIAKGQMVIVNGTRLINNPTARDYVFTQDWSLIKAELNRRMPADPNVKPVSVVLDETRNLFDIPAFANEIGDISPVYRSRKVQLYVVIQALSQLDKVLQEKIWLLGNIVTFGMENKKDCEAMAYQLAKYFPQQEKLPSLQPNANPITEAENGQDRERADWIWSLDERQCLVKRFLTESKRDPRLRYVPRTKDLPHGPLEISLEEFKEGLLKARGVKVRDALEVVDHRTLQKDKVDRTQPPLLDRLHTDNSSG